MYKLLCCNQYGNIVIPETGEVLLKGINDYGYRNDLAVYFETLDECKVFAKEWIRKYPHRGCTIFKESKEIAIYSYDTFFQ